MPRDAHTSPVKDHELRYKLANELHARPFPTLEAPCHAAYLAIKRPEDAASRDRDVDRAHLIALLDRHGAPHPSPGATHWFGQLGRHQLKWEAHTEFVTYTLFGDGVAERPFDGTTFDAYPEDWLADAPGVRMTSALIRVQGWPGEEAIVQKISEWFVPESLAASRVLDDSATIAGDFRIDENGHMRFAVFVRDECGSRRVGRIVQRLCEIETYKTMSMLGFARVRDMGPELTRVDEALTSLVDEMAGDVAKPDQTLKALLEVSSELEAMGARSSYRFGATGAYEAIVNQRIEVLREERFGGRQTFAEFMMRRYDPAMRTVKAAQGRLEAMSERASRASSLLRTRVDVERSAQNQTLLESMDKRADLQLRLQKTVEGLSTVAISYYAVNLVVYMLEPFGAEIGLGKLALMAITTPLVILAVWWMVRRIRKSL
ncbi:DUF3422 family protein [Aestuariibius sp. 2305UL40-4]|uniref:DUF3422 family protein n=1 Tax=Aestuariibius violaceus TaxID=3234132 RepID=UPI00345E9E9A